MVLKNGNIYADDDSVNTPNKLFLTCSAMIFFRISKKFINLKSHCTDPDETFCHRIKNFLFSRNVGKCRPKLYTKYYINKLQQFAVHSWCHFIGLNKNKLKVQTVKNCI